MAYDAEDDVELVLYDDYDDNSDVYRPRVLPKKGQGRFSRKSNQTGV